jgi:hypothetical protein
MPSADGMDKPDGYFFADTGLFARRELMLDTRHGRTEVYKAAYEIYQEHADDLILAEASLRPINGHNWPWTLR